MPFILIAILGAAYMQHRKSLITQAYQTKVAALISSPVQPVVTTNPVKVPSSFPVATMPTPSPVTTSPVEVDFQPFYTSQL